jgi:cardiolipin synthase
VTRQKGKNIFERARENLMQYTWWELALFIIGGLSFITLIVILFLPIGKGPGKFTITAPVAGVNTQEFKQTLSDSLNLPYKEGEPIQILQNGDAFMSALLPDIDNARTSINVMTYVWQSGSMSSQVFEHLDKKLKEGVEVRIVLDAIGASGAAGKEDLKTFKSLGGKVQTFHSLTVIPWNITSNQRRNHQRAIVIDGKIGYTGGMAVADMWLGNARNDKEYRDTMFRTTGPMVSDIQSAFAEVWTSNTGELLVGDKFFPVLSNSANALSYIPLVSIPSPDTLTIQKFILLSLMAAQDKIYISTPYFIPDQTFKETLISKAKAGVDVRVLVPDEHNDSAGVRHASQYFYQDLLAAGVKIYEYQPTFIHAKIIMIDGSWSIIGSANMDNRSRQLNDEDIFGVSSADFASQLQGQFKEDLKSSEEINLADWEKRSLWQRAREIFDLKFIEQY